MLTIDLGGSWKARDLSSTLKAIPAQVPGCIHLDLLRAKKLPDLNWRDNELQHDWVYQRDWQFTRTITAPTELLECDRIDLECDGLDTLATLSINGTVVLEADNMHRRWRAAVKRALKPGRNEICATFRSPLPTMAAGEKRRKLPSWNSYRPEFAGKSYVRKMACSFGWDWGPVAPTAGIWRGIRLTGWSAGRIDDVRIRQRHQPGRVDLAVTTTVERSDQAALTTRLTLTLDGETVASASGAPGQTLDLTVDKPRLWWPNGMGGQPLYVLLAELVDADGTVIDVQERRLGLRTVEVVQDEDQWGLSFKFRCNGLDVFAKGANWIPADIFVPRLTRADYVRLLGAAQQSHMNMIRLWGGGIFEEDAFYDLCDEYGLLIWHDFMFACSTYPTHEEAFMRSVEAETVDNLKRLRHHPAIALWCGNNELEQGLAGDGWTDRHMDWADYKRLFDDLLPRLVHEHDGERFYWPCSPHTPRGDRKNFNDPTSGDAHCWDVWFGWAPFSAQRGWTHRFQSEFGFQSFPEVRTLRTFAAEEDLNLTSHVMDFHQRSVGRGNKCILAYIGDYLPFPKDLDATTWLSQVSQAECIRIAVEHARRSQPRCMGTLYWQLNDLWPAPTWSSIDSVGRWKALQHASRRFFAPVLVSALEDETKHTVAIHLSNHRPAGARFTVAWTVTDTAGRKLLAGAKNVDVGSQAGLAIETLDLAKLVEKHSARNLLVWLEAREGKTVVARNLVSVVRWKHLDLRDPAIITTIASAEDGAFALTLKAKRPALFVRVQLADADADWSDNGFHLPAGQVRTISFRPWQKLTLAQARKRLSLTSLVDTY